jgi:hypothetical protein
LDGFTISGFHTVRQYSTPRASNDSPWAEDSEPFT